MPLPRIKFETDDLTNDLPISITQPDLAPGEPPHIYVGDQLHYAIYGTTNRGGPRREGAKDFLSKLRRIYPDFKWDLDTLRLLYLGGVKGSGASAHPNPISQAEARRLNPHLELYGSGAPAMMGGCLLMGIMISERPARATMNQFGKLEFPGG